MRLFFCNAHGEMNESFALYVRANTHEEAARLMIDYWAVEGCITTTDHIEGTTIAVLELPAVEGIPGVVDWGEINWKQVPKEVIFFEWAAELHAQIGS